MKNNNIVAALYNENRIGPVISLIIAGAVLLLCVVLCFLGDRELARAEGLYATSATEYTPGLTTTAHSVIQTKVHPLYPALVSLVRHSCLPMETALRSVSLFMLIAWAALAGFAAAGRRNYRAGIVTFLFCLTSIFFLDKGGDGGPETLTAFFLLCAQLTFFYFGSRKANWNLAWLTAGCALALAFLAGGFVAVLFFVFPILFLRRPLSLRSKYNTPGFAVGLLLLLLVITGWGLSTGLALREYGVGVELPAPFTWEYFKELITFPLALVIRLLPWSFIAWLPFCVALQDIDPSPGYSRYLRTVFFASFVLVWILPDLPSRSYFYIIAPLAILTGINYDLGVRRYGTVIRKLLFFGEFFFIGTMLSLALFYILPASYLKFAAPEDELVFREAAYFLPATLIALALLFVLWMIFKLSRKNMPVWSLLLMIFLSLTIFTVMLVLPLNLKEQRWRTIGGEIVEVFKDSPPPVIYKSDFDGLYNALFYTKVPIVKLRNINELPATKQVIFLLTPEVPPSMGRTWQVLYNFSNAPVRLWRGELLNENTESGDDE